MHTSVQATVCAPHLELSTDRVGSCGKCFVSARCVCADEYSDNQGVERAFESVPKALPPRPIIHITLSVVDSSTSARRRQESIPETA
jgi:hypothetical protein